MVINSLFKVVPMLVPITIGMAARSGKNALLHHDKTESGDDGAGMNQGREHAHQHSHERHAGPTNQVFEGRRLGQRFDLAADQIQSEEYEPKIESGLAEHLEAS